MHRVTPQHIHVNDQLSDSSISVSSKKLGYGRQFRLLSKGVNFHHDLDEIDSVDEIENGQD